MKVVLDTNILLVSISPKSPYRWIFDAFLSETFSLCVTTDILAEYEEIIGRETTPEMASLTLQLIENAVNTELITRYFEWH
jgi:predicted nucleic acid-binding protein